MHAPRRTGPHGITRLATSTPPTAPTRPRHASGGEVTPTAPAQATSSLRFGTLITGTRYQHPAVLANLAATLEIISAGRLELDLGLGLGTARERSGRFKEACHIITSLLTQTTTTFYGKRYQLTEPCCGPKPTQRPH